MDFSYPDVTLEEAETVADVLGWDQELRNIVCVLDGHEMSGEQINGYIFNLLGGMFGEFEDGVNGQTWADCPQIAKDFYYRVCSSEVVKVKKVADTEKATCYYCQRQMVNSDLVWDYCPGDNNDAGDPIFRRVCHNCTKVKLLGYDVDEV